jgi:hypothetical protein
MEVPGTWVNPNDIGGEDLKCYSVGFIVKEFPDHIVLVGSKFRDGSLVSDANRIPTAHISVIAPLKLVNPKEKN